MRLRIVFLQMVLVTCVFGQNSPEQTIAADTQEIQLHPDNYQAYNDRGNAKLVLRDFEGGIADYNAAIRLNPNYAFAYNGRGNACSQEADEDDLDQAVTDYDTAIRLNPKYAHAFNGRGYAKLAQDGIKEALDDFTQAIALNPNYAHAYFNRGVTEYLLGQTEPALADLTKSTELDPESGEAWTFRWLARAQHPDQVSAANKELSDYLHANRVSTWGASVIHFFLGDISESDFLKAASSGTPASVKDQQCQAYFYIGAKAEIAGDKTGAIAAYRHCLETDEKIDTDYVLAKAKIHQQDHPETAGQGRPPAYWITGKISATDGVLLFEADRPINDNPLGKLVLLGSTSKAMSQLFLQCTEKPEMTAVRLYGFFLHFDQTIPGHTGPLPNVEFRAWKLHMPTDPDVLPQAERMNIHSDTTPVSTPTPK